MSFISVHTGHSSGFELTYVPARVDHGLGLSIGALVRVSLESDMVTSNLVLDIEHARQLAEQLPALVMAHDAAEHVRLEQIAAVKAATESKAA